MQHESETTKKTNLRNFSTRVCATLEKPHTLVFFLVFEVTGSGWPATQYGRPHRLDWVFDTSVTRKSGLQHESKMAQNGSKCQK